MEQTSVMVDQQVMIPKQTPIVCKRYTVIIWNRRLITKMADWIDMIMLLSPGNPSIYQYVQLSLLHFQW